MKGLLAAAMTKGRLSTIYCVILAAGTLLFSNGTFAVVDNATVERLIRQVELLSQRVKELEAADKTLRSDTFALKEAANASSKISDKLAWAEKIQLKGDFRYRYENIDDGNNSKNQNRSRLRARVEAQAQINNEWRVGLGLASGGDKPTTTNQTLGGGGSTKGINLDLAYFDWSGLENTHVIGGKFKNPFYRPASNGLLWDNDYRPEGLAVKYANDLFFANAAFIYLESDDKAGSKDAESFWAAQFGFNKAINDSAELIAGLSYYDISVAGSKPFFDEDDSFGNTLAGDGTFLNDYEELELFIELKTSIADLPASIFVDWVENQDADDNDTGFATGFRLGKAKNQGTWQVSYIYQDLEADAVLGLTTDSDFGGGGTNNKGHIINGAYAFDNNALFSLTYYMQEYGELDTDYDRLQFDLKFKY